MTAFFYRDDYVSDLQDILYKRAPASDKYIVRCISPRASEASGGRMFKFSVYSLLKRVVVYYYYSIRRAKRAVNVLCLLSS